MKLKDKLKSVPGKLLNLAKASISFLIHYAVLMTCVSVIALCIMKLPELNNKWLRSKVGSKVYTIRDNPASGGGTGFAVKGPSGQSYIMTNDHVCGVSSDKRTVLVEGEEGMMRRNIIAHDQNSDLCLIEGMPGVEGLSVAWSAPGLGDEVTVVGHPLLMPTHVIKGEMMGRQDISIMMGPISVINPDTNEDMQIPPEKGGILAAECSMPKNSQQLVELNMFFFMLKVKFCMVNIKQAYTTSAVIYPGNSGSPMVNFWGNIVGAVFASDSEANFARVISIEDIKAFLKNY